jgi:hypothetical protein
VTLWSAQEQGKTLWVRATKPASAQIDCYVGYYTCIWDALTYYGYNNVQVGELHLSIYFTLDIRSTNYWQYSEVASGPAINAEHAFNCVDHHFPSNASCSNGWRDHTHGTFTTTTWSWPVQWQTTFSNNDEYWMDFDYYWQAQGYGSLIWTSGRFTTNHWICYSGADCEFQV